MRLGLLVVLSFALSGAEPPRRIVSLSPDLTEMLYGVGAFSLIVAVSDYDTYPPGVEKLPRLGQLHSPSFEKLTSMRPDLVVINSAQGPLFEDTLKDLGIRFMEASNRSVSEAYAAMLALGRATGNDAAAVRLVAATREGLDRVSRKTAQVPKRKVVLIVDRTPGTLRDLYTATEGSYLGELVQIAGGIIALPPVQGGYAKLRTEDLLAANPDVILDLIQGPINRFAGDPREAWQEMPELRAVREHHVYSVNEDYVPHASQRMVQTAELFAHLIHPEIP